GVTNGWLTSEDNATKTHTSTWLLNPPVQLQDGEKLILTVAAGSLVPVRASVSPFVVDESAPERPEELYFVATAADPDVFARYVELHRQLKECRDGKAWTMVTVATEPTPVRVLPRGNWLDESGPVVVPSAPHFLPGTEPPADRRLT